MSDKPKEDRTGFTVTSAGKHLGIRHSLKAVKQSVGNHRRVNPSDSGPFRIVSPKGEEWVSRLSTTQARPGKPSYPRIEWKEIAKRH
jgi:hypothetical protein